MMSEASSSTSGREASGSTAEGRPQVEPAVGLEPINGWHFLHLFYRLDRGVLAGMSEADRSRGAAEFVEILSRSGPGSPDQMQAFTMVGHKGDFGAVMAGPDLMALHSVQSSLSACALGPALVPTYSFYSITEVSEYVPDVEAYGRILQDREGLAPESTVYQTKLKQYSNRLGAMNRQRMYPEFPGWPCVCFYPMSKARRPGQNWYLLPFEERSDMMAEHGRSGMKFAGKVSQVITASTGLDDWEWGVTLWATNPTYLKDIVYTMRFDRSSAEYAEFGPFYPGFILPPDELARAIRL